MFQPVSRVAYHMLSKDKQILVCALEGGHTHTELLTRWRERAAATLSFSTSDSLTDVVRDLLANPQIRAVVLVGAPEKASAFQDFWQRKVPLKGDIKEDHQELVRQFVDLFTDDCNFHKPQQPFWPQRILYREG